MGEPQIYENEARVNAVLTLKNGLVGTFLLNGDSAAVDRACFTIYGTKGKLRLGDANQFGSEICLMPDEISLPAASENVRCFRRLFAARFGCSQKILSDCK